MRALYRTHLTRIRSLSLLSRHQFARSAVRSATKARLGQQIRHFGSGHGHGGDKIVSQPWPAHVVYPIAGLGAIAYVMAVVKRNNSNYAAPDYKVVLDREVAEGKRNSDYSLKH